MKLLLDTHILLWALAGDQRLSKKAAKLISDPQNEILVSAVSLWEVGVKHSMGRITVSPEILVEAIASTGFQELAVTFDHCISVSRLPPIHRDPFDRMLVAQSLSVPAILMTHDQTLNKYGSTILLV